VHESSLARQILAVVLQLAEREGVGRIYTVRGWVAETERLSPESLAFHFTALAYGTAADGAHLEMRLIHVEARCNACGRTYAPDHHLLVCPACGSVAAELLSPTGVGVDTVEVE